MVACLWDKLPPDVERRILAHALALRLREPSQARMRLNHLLGPERRLARVWSLAMALRLLAEHLGVPYELPGDEHVPCSLFEERYRLLRHEEHGYLRARVPSRFPRQSRRCKPETREWGVWARVKTCVF